MHDLRCEHSTSDPKRCRCTDCGGSKHGIQADEQREALDNLTRQSEELRLYDPVPPESNLGIHHWFEAWVTA